MLRSWVRSVPALVCVIRTPHRKSDVVSTFMTSFVRCTE